MRKRWVAGMVLVGLAQACGASGRQTYRPVEIDVQSRSATFARAAALMRERNLLILEEDESRGIVSTQWQAFGDEHYNVQVLISPVSAVVNVGCRIERAMNIEPCGDSTSYPSALVRDAKALTKALQ